MTPSGSTSTPRAARTSSAPLQGSQHSQFALDIEGGDGNDVIDGSDNADLIDAGAGDDQIAADDNPLFTQDDVRGGLRQRHDDMEPR